jgi:hypothetical protein
MARASIGMIGNLDRPGEGVTMPQGYQLVDPGLGLPEIGLDYDTQVRCLAYLLRDVRKLAQVPTGVQFELIPVQYLGDPYPCIGLFTTTYMDSDDELCDFSLRLSDQLAAYIVVLGVSRLVELSAGEAVCWEAVINSRLAPVAEARGGNDAE